MNINFKIISLFLFLFCFSGYGQQDTTSFLYQRSYKRLKEKGLSDLEAKNYIKESDSLNTLLFNQEMQRIEDEYLTNNPPAPPSTSCTEDQLEREVLFAIYNNLNGPAWANGWDFEVPITTWSTSSGVTFNQDCKVEKLIIASTSLTGTIPDLSNLPHLKVLILQNHSNGIYGSSSNFPINSSSAFHSIGSLSNLEHLVIWGADFNGSLPVNFINLAQKIKYFNLIDCNLNNVSQLSSIIGAYTQLEYLALTKNFIGPDSYDFALPQEFNNLINLKSIQIINSRINDFSSITSLSNLILIEFNTNSITGNLPNMSNLTSLINFKVPNNLITGNIPSYFQSFSFYHFNISNNYFEGTIPALNLTAGPNNRDLNFSYNKFKFNDFVDDFNIYNNIPSNIMGFRYSPQAKTDEIITVNKSVGQQVSMEMCIDGNHHEDDEYQWFKNGIAISGAQSRIYTFTAGVDSGGVYTCKSYHYSPPMTNSNNVPNKNLILERNPITLNIVEPIPCDDCTSFELLTGERYVISGWVKEANEAGVTNNNVYHYTNSSIEVSFVDVSGTIINSAISFLPIGAIIDGWQQIKGEFTVPSNVDDMKIELVNNNMSLSSFFDDIRVHPFNGNLKSFVYDQASQRLMAELDENNYATFYEYDKEGGLVRVKKETERGVYTIQETRSSTQKKD